MASNCLNFSSGRTWGYWLLIPNIQTIWFVEPKMTCHSIHEKRQVNFKSNLSHAPESHKSLKSSELILQTHGKNSSRPFLHFCCTKSVQFSRSKTLQGQIVHVKPKKFYGLPIQITHQNAISIVLLWTFIAHLRFYKSNPGTGCSILLPRTTYAGYLSELYLVLQIWFHQAHTDNLNFLLHHTIEPRRLVSLLDHVIRIKHEIKHVHKHLFALLAWRFHSW